MHRSWIGRAMPVLILLLAALLRVWLIDVDGASFDSDEAIVGLMARHITQGEPIPTFFYGQDYMGSLDALLTAGGFVLFGESVDTIRAVQVALYLLTLLTAYVLAQTITLSRRIALITLLLLAFPTPLGALYSTITLGGYNELVICGNLLLLLGWQITVEERRGMWRWALLGLITGIG
ncbi:MAG: glycosyltransferase family 39 protein, partial [Anaerolineae bacterium]|nr:glycosyltransferase family 39 protein [Anaerolineae bacterium]